MGYTIPGWLDEILDFIGINFPNVDEDDYREMATSMRDFAEKFEGHGGDAHKAFGRILSSSEGWAVDAMEKHWGHVKAEHLDKVPEIARLFADACDVVADIIFGMKRKAEVELAVMAGSVGISLGLSVVTGGLSALIGAAEIAAMRQLVKRIVDEAVDRIVEELTTRVTEPVTAKLEKLAEDAVLDLVEGAFQLPPGEGGGKKGPGMQLASAGGGGGPDGGVGEKKLHIDHLEFEDGAGKVAAHGGELSLAIATPFGKAKSSFGKTKGKDPFTATFDGVLEGALNGAEKAVKKITKHVTETVPDKVKATSKTHKGNDTQIGEEAKQVRTYLLNADGSVDRLHADGSTNALDDHDRTRLNGVIDTNDKIHIPTTDAQKAVFYADAEHDGRVKSEKVDPKGYDLADATVAARRARGDEKGTNYAAGRYIDAEGRESILVGYSNKAGHSERMIGRPLLHGGVEGNLKEIFTEREPCVKNPQCARWLDYFFPDDLKVTHAADYYDDKGKTTNKEHNTYRAGLKGIL
ncbi:nucleic acid/nucleotide deaminase domain-containing protein [Streptomyces sp. NPDC001595]